MSAPIGVRQKSLWAKGAADARAGLDNRDRHTGRARTAYANGFRFAREEMLREAEAVRVANDTGVRTAPRPVNREDVIHHLATTSGRSIDDTRAFFAGNGGEEKKLLNFADAIAEQAARFAAEGMREATIDAVKATYDAGIIAILSQTRAIEYTHQRIDGSWVKKNG